MKPLNQDDFKMLIIEDLGMIKKNNNRKVRTAIFKCTKCFIEFSSITSNARHREQSMCKSCSLSKHGLRKTRQYRIWRHIKDRCYNENTDYYEYYGGRGIGMCDEWLSNPELFFNWSINNGYSKELEIDRIDNNKGYSPDNCRWVDKFTQAQNKRIRKNNKSGYIGVFKVHDNKFRSKIMVKGVVYNLGYHKTALKAAIAYDNYIINNNLEHTINSPT